MVASLFLHTVMILDSLQQKVKNTNMHNVFIFVSIKSRHLGCVYLFSNPAIDRLEDTVCRSGFSSLTDITSPVLCRNMSDIVFAKLATGSVVKGFLTQ